MKQMPLVGAREVRNVGIQLLEAFFAIVMELGRYRHKKSQGKLSLEFVPAWISNDFR